MKIKFQNQAFIVYSSLIVIGFIITGLLLTTKNHTASGLATTTTFMLMATCTSWGAFSTPYKQVRKRNTIRIILMVVFFHVMPTLFTYGLHGINLLCKTNHPKKFSETFKKTHASVKNPILKIKEYGSNTLGSFVKPPIKEETPEEKKIEEEPVIKEEETEKDPFAEYFSYAYLILFASILASIYKILLSWKYWAFLTGIITVAGGLTFIHWINYCDGFWKSIISLTILILIGITCFLGKEYQANPATY